MTKLLSSYGEIKNQSRCISELKNQVKVLARLTDEKVVETVNKKVDEVNTRRYFTYDYMELSESESGKQIMWLDTGYENILGNKIYVQFTGGNPWYGALVGAEESIKEAQKNANEARKGLTKESLGTELGVDLDSIEGVTVVLGDEAQGIEKVIVKNNFFTALHERLLIPNSWTTEYLYDYLFSCISRINSLLANGENVGKYLIFNKDNSTVLFNSGLLDRFGKNIILSTKVVSIVGDVIELSSSCYAFAGSKVTLVENGFSKESLTNNIVRVDFTNSLSDLVFTGNIDDLDLDSRSRLEHCINERKFRFPEPYVNATPEVICADITKAVELAVELNKCDRNYIKPMYNRKRDSIDFIIPYHVGNDFQRKPDLGIVVANKSGYWQIMTVLSYEDVLRDVKLFNMYENETF